MTHALIVLICLIGTAWLAAGLMRKKRRALGITAWILFGFLLLEAIAQTLAILC
ncbi:MAG: hypothetical protein RLN76_13825 [Phycisphaeraceae bacterium]